MREREAQNVETKQELEESRKKKICLTFLPFTSIADRFSSLRHFEVFKSKRKNCYLKNFQE